MSVGDRLKKARDYLGFTQSELAEPLGYKWSKVKDMESEKLKLTPEIADIMEQKYSISGWWLLTGKGEMLLSDTPANQISSNDEGYMVDVLSVRAGAGPGVYNYSVEVVDHLMLDRSFFRTVPDISKVKIIEVDGDSMEPTIPNGSFIVIDETKSDKIDGIFAIQLDGQILVKRLQFKLDGTIKIISDNNHYEPQLYVPDETQVPMHIIGRKILSIQR